MAIPNNAYYNLAYSLGQPLANIFPSPVVASRAPTTADINHPIGQLWVFVSSNACYVLTSVVANSANWEDVTGAAGSFTSLTVNPGPTNLSTVGVGAVNVGNASNTSAVTITSGTGGVSVVGGGNTITIGTDAAANTVEVGSTNNGAITEIQGGNSAGVGNAAIELLTAAAGDIQIGNTTHTGHIYVGTSTAVAGETIFVGNSAAPNTVTVGSTNGAAVTTIQAGTGGLVFSPTAGNASMTPATNSAAGTTVVLNARVGVATYTGQTTASAGTITLTLTNSLITATSCILMTLNNVGTNDAELTVQRINPGVGTCAIIAKNNGAAALNGNINVSFWIMS